MSRSTVNEIVNALGGTLSADGSAMVHCPAHDDRNPSLHVTPKDGKILVYCHAGCSQEQIIDKLKARGLWVSANATDGKNSPRPKGIPERWEDKWFSDLWAYRNQEDKIIGYVARYNNKNEKAVIPFFKKKGSTWKAVGPQAPSTLYGLENIVRHSAKPLLICEGEKAADAAQKIVGESHVCITWQGGCKATEKADWSTIAGRQVYIWPDADDEGDKAAQEVSKHCKSAGAKSISIISPPDGVPNGWDLADALNEGWTQKNVIKHIDENQQPEEGDPTISITGNPKNGLALARHLFPRTEFPWHILPQKLTESYKQLARSCATSANPIPGTGFAVMASVVGEKGSIKAKLSWEEPLIIWHGHIGETGIGKTVTMWKLAWPIIAKQKKADDNYKTKKKEYDQLDLKQQRKQKEPERAQTYYSTDFTLEGLRSALEQSKTGGVLIIVSELSSIFSGQNQYKKNGNDREAYLCLYDGKPARVIRVNKTIILYGARPSVTGGVQPGVFKKIMLSDDGKYLEDGTIFRFIFNYEPIAHYPLTTESWSEENRYYWEGILKRAIEWVEKHEGDAKSTFTLTKEALNIFLEWTNSVGEIRVDLLKNFRGYLPKAFGAALRLAACIHLIHEFASGADTPHPEIDSDGILRGIAAAKFYLGQAVDAMSATEFEHRQEPAEMSERTLLLAKTLELLKEKVDNGKLAVGFVLDKFNSLAPPEQHFNSPHSFGAFLRSCKLTIPEAKTRANGRSGVKCVLWDNAMDAFLLTLLTSQNQCQHLGSQDHTGFVDNEDNVDFKPKENEKLKNQDILKSEKISPLSQHCPQTHIESGLPEGHDVNTKSTMSTPSAEDIEDEVLI